MKPDPVDAALARLAAAMPGTPEGRKIFAAALASKQLRLVVKAARLVEGFQAAEFCPQMSQALAALMARGDGADKGCAAMLAAGKGGATKYPLRCRPIKMPRSVSACSARVTVVRDSPNSAASVRLAGSAAPGSKNPAPPLAPACRTTAAVMFRAAGRSAETGATT